MDNNIINQQIEYYRARAQEYDETIFSAGETDNQWDDIVQALQAMGPFGHIFGAGLRNRYPGTTIAQDCTGHYCY